MTCNNYNLWVLCQYQVSSDIREIGKSLVLGWMLLEGTGSCGFPNDASTDIIAMVSGSNPMAILCQSCILNHQYKHQHM